ncbi:MAG: molybdopterin-dependent oxidoreductase, partial [Proteobacteria bacterium]|nr:molybdopterin-dependent oxidoreductase [Pseudomonadota bacterium]
LLEPGLSSFANPQEATGLLGHATSLAELHVQVRINGDMLFLQGMMKHLLEEERRKPGTVFDSAFIVGQTTGVDALIESLDHTDWADIERGSGVDRTVMEQAADIYRQAGSCIATWGLGITHQMNGTHTVRQILNLLLLRGNIGRTGAGACPMRGHSNILGIRSMGCGEKMPGTFLDSLEQQFRFTAPRRPGLGAVHALRAMHQGEAKVCISLGGNLAAVAPDTGYAAQALRTADLTVMIATKLNRSHVTCGRTALLLPCLGRSEIDAQDGVVQYVSVEDAMGNVRASQGCLEPVAPGILGKPRIVAEMAGAVLGDVPGIEWRALAGDYGRIRAMIERTVPAYAGFAGRLDRREHCAVPNPIRGRDFSAIGGKAKFAPMPVAQDHPDSDAGFRLMSIRSHDQFNTTIFGLDDRYRNIRNQRRVVFMNEDDMEELGIGPEQAVVITSHHGGRTLSAPPFYAIAHAIPRRCAAVYFPEANGLVPRDRLDAQTGTPAYKFIPVSIAIHVVDSRG